MTEVPAAPLQRGARFWTSRVLLLGGALGLGLVLQQLLSDRLAAIQALSRHDVVQARRELAFVLRAAAIGVFGWTGLVGVMMIACCRRAVAAGRFPPPGPWSWGAMRVVTGARALTLARLGRALGYALVLCSLAGGSLTWYMAAQLLACRAP
jgi:hypothetical protein